MELAHTLSEDLLELILSLLCLHDLCRMRRVSRDWCEVAKRDVVIVASSAKSGLITRTQLRALLGLTSPQAALLPCRPYVTLKGHTCWLYGPMAVRGALELVRREEGVVAGRKRRRSRYECDRVHSIRC